MTFKITKTNNKQILVKAESWLDLLRSLSNDVVKIERIEWDKAESEDKE
jgi:hypothetical protein